MIPFAKSSKPSFMIHPTDGSITSW